MDSFIFAGLIIAGVAAYFILKAAAHQFALADERLNALFEGEVIHE